MVTPYTNIHPHANPLDAKCNETPIVLLSVRFHHSMAITDLYDIQIGNCNGRTYIKFRNYNIHPISQPGGHAMGYFGEIYYVLSDTTQYIHQTEWSSGHTLPELSQAFLANIVKILFMSAQLLKQLGEQTMINRTTFNILLFSWLAYLITQDSY